jgi:hypothetical protein
LEGYEDHHQRAGWTSYDLASCNITIMAEPSIETMPSRYYAYLGNVSQGQRTGWITIPIPKGTTIADIRLYWLHDWSTYPTSDIDMYIYWDQGYNFDGATLNSPERAVLIKPTYIYVYIYGYTHRNRTTSANSKLHNNKTRIHDANIKSPFNPPFSKFLPSDMYIKLHETL